MTKVHVTVQEIYNSVREVELTEDIISKTDLFAAALNTEDEIELHFVRTNYEKGIVHIHYPEGKENTNKII
ncbi:MAG: hypothetical protein U9O94_06215 [Nanoarchaeota archaeon]|nr:hypothetical protein [Nanoarchaeota archaeon]